MNMYSKIFPTKVDMQNYIGSNIWSLDIVSLKPIAGHNNTVSYELIYISTYEIGA